MMRYIFKFVGLAVLGIFTAFMSGYIPVYEQVDELATIGVKTYSGLPIPHVMNAPGLSRADWRIDAFYGNSAIYSVLYWIVVGFIASHFTKRQRSASSS